MFNRLTNGLILSASSITRKEKYPLSHETWLQSLCSKFLFYGLNNAVLTKNRSRLIPSKYKPSPFFTLSESIGMKMIEDEVITSTSNLLKPSNVQNIDFNPDESSPTNIENRENYEEQLVSLSEDLQIIDVSIADVLFKLDRIDCKLNHTQKDFLAIQFANFKLKHEKLIDYIHRIQIGFAN